MGTREEIVRAVTEGRAAARSGTPVTACPYEPPLRAAWIRGYRQVAPPSQADVDRILNLPNES